MLGLCFVYVGEPKDSFIREGIAEYEKRISAFARVRNICVRPSPLPDRPTDGEISCALEKEAAHIYAELSTLYGYRKIALCVEGKQLSSEELSEFISSSAVTGFSGAAFVIGSSHGLSDTVKSACGIRMSLSKMTLPHALARLVLCEQAYRALSIAAGGKYHK